MLSENKRLRSLKATIYSSYIDLKTTWLIFTSILTGLLFLEFFLMNMLASGSSSSNTSMLNSGFITAILVMGVAMIVITSNGELLCKFSFPVDRINLMISHVLFIFAGSLILLLTSCALYLVELLLSSIITFIFPGFVYIGVITQGSFLTGFFTSWITIIGVSSIVYFAFMYFFRYKLATSITAGILILLSVNFGSIGQAISAVMNDIFLNSGPVMLFIKLLGVSVLFLALSFIPLKRMEVRR